MNIPKQDKAIAYGYGMDKSPYGSGCTQAFMTGITSVEGNMNGQCVDSPVGWCQGYIQLVIPKKRKQISDVWRY